MSHQRDRNRNVTVYELTPPQAIVILEEVGKKRKNEKSSLSVCDLSLAFTLFSARYDGKDMPGTLKVVCTTATKALQIK